MEVEEAAGTLEVRSVNEQGTPSADLTDLFGTVMDSSRHPQSVALKQSLGSAIMRI